MADASVMRPKRPNPFASTRELNPLSMVDAPLLVKVPDAPETHERRKPMRGYLSGTGGPLDNLFSLLDGKQPQVPRKIEVVRDAPARASDDGGDEDAGPPPPRFGRR
jgi:hypothetical protein